MTEERYLNFSRVAYGLCSEILDSPGFLPIYGSTKHFAQGDIVMLI